MMTTGVLQNKKINFIIDVVQSVCVVRFLCLLPGLMFVMASALARTSPPMPSSSLMRLLPVWYRMPNGGVLRHRTLRNLRKPHR